MDLLECICAFPFHKSLKMIIETVHGSERVWAGTSYGKMFNVLFPRQRGATKALNEECETARDMLSSFMYKKMAMQCSSAQKRWYLKEPGG